MHSFIEKSARDLKTCGIICLKWTPDRRLKDRLLELTPVIELTGDPAASLPRQFWRALCLCWRCKSALFQGWMYHGCMLAVLFKLLVVSRSQIWWAIHSSGIVSDGNVFRAGELYSMGLVCRIVGATVIYCGENSESTHVSNWRWPQAQARVIKNGIDTGRFVPSAHVYAKIREDHKISKEALILGYVGRWHPDKDVETLCRALAIVAAKLPQLVVIFCGNGLDHKNDFFSGAISSIKNATCICLGEVEDTSQLMPSFDILCLSSRREAFPLVLCEALACGVPCIATDVGDCRGIIGSFGRVVPPGDPQSLAESIVEYAAFLRGEDVARLRVSARNWATELLDEEKAAHRYVTLLKATRL